MNVDSVAHVLGSPVKSRIIMCLTTKGDMTPKVLRAELPDVPQATLYRILRKMEAEGLIEVVGEEKKRACVEKTYSLSPVMRNVKQEAAHVNNMDAFMSFARGGMIQILSKFEDYSKKENFDLVRDGPSFKTISIFATTVELEELHSKIRELIAPMTERRSADQTCHTVALVVAPPEDGDYNG